MIVYIRNGKIGEDLESHDIDHAPRFREYYDGLRRGEGAGCGLVSTPEELMTINLLSARNLAMAAMIALLWLMGCDSGAAGQEFGPLEVSEEVRQFTLIGYMNGYVGVGGEIDGQKNPVLRAHPGDEVEIRFINGENMPHDIALRAHDTSSEILLRADEETTFRFVAQSDDRYYCTIPGHEQAGMVGDFKVSEIPRGSQPVAHR